MGLYVLVIEYIIRTGVWLVKGDFWRDVGLESVVLGYEKHGGVPTTRGHQLCAARCYLSPATLARAALSTCMQISAVCLSGLKSANICS